MFNLTITSTAGRINSQTHATLKDAMTPAYRLSGMQGIEAVEVRHGAVALYVWDTENEGRSTKAQERDAAGTFPMAVR